MAASSSPRIPDTGLAQIVCPDNPHIDIVFVHGFTGHPFTTWLDKHPPVKNSGGKGLSRMSIRKKFGKSTALERKPVDPTYWPRDLVPGVVPQARVLTYGYDTHVRHRLGPPRSQSTVYDIGSNFLSELEAKRRPGGRPILFIAHSLGGIIVKEMLRKSSGSHQPHLRDVCDSTAGIIFFGTPHGGSDPRGFLQKIAEQVFRIAGGKPNEAVVNSLLPASSRLTELRDEFGPIAHERKWLIQSFQEDVGVRLLGGKVVEDTSSCLNLPQLETKQHINRNHMDMCRFSGIDDVEFEKVAAALERLSLQAVSKLSPTEDREEEEVKVTGMPGLTEVQKAKVRKGLASISDNMRLVTQTTALPRLDWMDDEKLSGHSGILWIKGKPGAGKSTLMKYMTKIHRGDDIPGDVSSPDATQTAVIAFFFNRRGTELEQSILGLYRSILSQLLDLFPECWMSFSSEGKKLEREISRLQRGIESLKDFIRLSVTKLKGGRLIVFIDALDECDEDQVRDMISYIEQLTKITSESTSRVRFCFSSRHYPRISLRKGIIIVLDDRQEHQADIKTYIDSTLKIGHGNLAETIQKGIQGKASGIFMWVVLVVPILNKQYDQGRVQALKRTLEALPSDLHRLFQDIIKTDTDNTDEVLLCLQWILFAEESLSPEELYYAIQSGVRGVPSSRGYGRVNMDAMHNFILNASKGLAEITKGRQPKVQFIHETVQDFLLEEGLASLAGTPTASIRGESHDRLKVCCLVQIRGEYEVAEPQLSNNAFADEPQVQARIYDNTMFLRRSLGEVLYQADKAQGLGVDQVKFVQTFDVNQWITTYNKVGPDYGAKREYEAGSDNFPLAYLFAQYDCPNLFRVLWHLGDPHARVISKPTPRGLKLVLVCAANSGSKNLLKTAFELHLDQLGLTDAIPAIHSVCGQTEDWSPYRRKAIPSEMEGLLLNILGNSTEDLFCFWILHMHATGELKIQRDLLHPLYRGWVTALRLMLRCIEVSTVAGGETIHPQRLEWRHLQDDEILSSLLQKHKVAFNHVDEDGQTMLMEAVKGKHMSIVKLLLSQQTININSTDSRGTTALHYGIRALNHSRVSESDLAIVQLLVERGADLEARDSQGQTALSLASRRGQLATMRYLLAQGAEIDTKSVDGRTPLSYASNTHPWCIRLLIEQGAALDSTCEFGYTALIRALKAGRDVIPRMLIRAGADVNLSSRDSRTPLSYAVQCASLKTCALLVKAGARVDSLSPNLPQSSLPRAAFQYLYKNNFLIQSGEDADAFSSVAQTPLCYAAQSGKFEIAVLLIAHGADVNLADGGRWPLLCAVQRADHRMASLLVQAGALSGGCCAHGRTPLSHAATADWGWDAGGGWCTESILSLILSIPGVEVDARDRCGMTPLHHACSSTLTLGQDWPGSQVRLVKQLLEAGANPCLSDDLGRNALWHATRDAIISKALVEVLLDFKAIAPPDQDVRGMSALDNARRFHGQVNSTESKEILAMLDSRALEGSIYD